MTKDKRSKDIDIEKLRMILDNPSNPKIREIVAKHEKNLESIRERLSGKSSKTKMRHTTSDFLKKSDSLEPRVIIHEKEEEVVPSEIEPTETELQKEESKDEVDIQDLFDDEELYEVEKVDVSESEFLEVRPKEIEKMFEKTPEKTEERLPTPIQEEKEPIKEMHVNEEKLPEWESVEETKPEVAPGEKEKQAMKEFTEVATIDEKVEPPRFVDETEEEIPTWEPMELEKTKEEISSEFVEEKPADETLEQVSEQKEEPATAVKETKVELKRAEKELKKKRKEEQKLKKLEEKKKKRDAKQREREARKDEKEKQENLQMKEYEQKQRQNEEEKLKNLEAMEEKKHVGEIVAQEKQEKDTPSRSELREQKSEAKKTEKEQEAQIKAQLKNEKILAASKKKEAKELKKKQKKNVKLKKTESKIPELKADADVSFEENVAEDTATEWESYDVEEMPEVKPDTSAYTHGDFTLYKKEIKTATGKKRTVHFFSKKIPDVGEPVQLPENYEVKVNKRTGLPYLKKNK